MAMRTSRRLAAVMVPISLLSLTLVACGGGEPSTGATPAASAKQEIPSEVIKTTVNKDLAAKLPKGQGRTLNFGVNLTSPPSRFLDEHGRPVGFNVDLSKLLAQKLGLTAKINDVPFEQIIPGLAARRYDLSLAGMSRTPERELELDMVEYMKGSGGVGVPAGNPKKVKASSLTSLCGQHLGALLGSFQELNTVPEIKKACAAKGLPTVKYTSYGTNNDAILALGSRRIDAVLASGAVTTYAAHEQPDVFASVIIDGTWSHDNIALRKDSPLTPTVAKAFQELMDEGSYAKVLEKWGIPNYALTKVSEVQTPVEQQ
ncbi:ABC transporter substrate-binding protein [Streptomyces chartreusis]|uniref:ABC transporter substrate-binding protein n=1 Tax=Streptomyces chartreusis TaxID=1969 RepID=UPI0036516898